ncbi:MAG: hypothetical protein AAGE88_18195 [Actinomycetota bacterium]
MEVLLAYRAFGEYEAGDPIAVLADGERWGRKESIDRWLADGFKAEDFPQTPKAILVIPNEPADLDLTEAETYPPDLVTGKRETSRRRAWYVDLDRLPRPIRRQLESPGARVVGRQAMRQHIRRKVDDAGLPPRGRDDRRRARRGGVTRKDRPRGGGPPGRT